MEIVTRRLLGNMWTILVLLASAIFGACAQTTVNVVVGEDVLLPCVCKENKRPFLVWQIGPTTIVDQYIAEYEKSNISPEFLGRTLLFLPGDTGNCSLLLKQVTTADNLTFTCHYEDPTYRSSEVTLNVVSGTPDARNITRSGQVKQRIAYSIGGVSLCAVLLLTALLAVIYRQRRSRPMVKNQGHFDIVNGPGAEEVELNGPGMV